MSLIARIQFVNFLTYSNPDSRDRKPALRVVEFWPLKYSTAINIPNGHGKTNMITVLLYLLSRDSKLKELALALFTPRRCGAPSHVRLQLWDLPDELARRDLTVDEGLLDPSQLPNNNDHYVFGLCAYHGEEPRFYYYRGILDDCDVFVRTDNGYIYHQEADVQQAVKRIGGTWNVSSVHEWRSLVTSHIPSRVLAQQVKFQLAGGGDKSAPLQQVEQEEDETFDQSFFRAIIAPELLASTGEMDGDPADPRDDFEDQLYAHFSKMASATMQAEREQRAIDQQEEAMHDLGTLAEAGARAQRSFDDYRELLMHVARDGAAIRHLVVTAPFPGLLVCERPPIDKAAELLPYVVIDRLHGLMVLDAGIAKLVGAETRRVNEVAFRKGLRAYEVDETQVIDFARDLKIFSAADWGGARVLPKGYSLDTGVILVGLLGAGDLPKATRATDILRQVCRWVEEVGDTNGYRKQIRSLGQDICQLQEHNEQLGKEIQHAQAKTWELNEKIAKYDQAKGAFADLVRSRLFTDPELVTPGQLGLQVSSELESAEKRLAAHDERVGSLKQVYAEHQAFVETHPEISAGQLLSDLLTAKQVTNQALLAADERVRQSKDAVARASSRAVALARDVQAHQQRLSELSALQSHQTVFKTWFGDTPPGDIDIASGLTRIASQEHAVAQRHRICQALHDELDAVIPAVPTYHALFPGIEPNAVDISGALVNIANNEHVLAERYAISSALQQRLSELAPFVASFRSLFGEADLHALDPAKERADLQHAIALTETAIETLEHEVSILLAFRANYPGCDVHAWLVDMEARRAALTRDVSACRDQVQTAHRQLTELRSDPVARPEEVAHAHKLIDDTVHYVSLHRFIEVHCPTQRKRHWLTHFSALLFSPVVETLADAVTAARLLYEGQASMPVLIADRLKSAMEDGAPMLALDGECAYTWLAGIKTRMVHCLLHPSAVEEERRLVKERLHGLQIDLEKKQQALDALSEQSEQVLLVRGAARADMSNAEEKLAAERARLTSLHQRLPEVLRRSAPDALESIAKAREDRELSNKYGKDVSVRVIAELKQLEAEIAELKALRSWHEARNTDEARAAIASMRRYQALLLQHGDDVLVRVEDELRQIADTRAILQGERRWHEDRNTDDARLAVSAMRRLLEAGGDREVERLRMAVQDSMIALESTRRQFHEETDALAQHEMELSSTQSHASTAATAYYQNERHLAELIRFADTDDLAFMESNTHLRTELAQDRLRAQTRKSYESQFVHAQRYVEQKDSHVSESELLSLLAAAEDRVKLAKEGQACATRAIDEKRRRQTLLEPFSVALHDAACRLLAEFRAVSRIIDDIGLTSHAAALRFENTELYKYAESVRSQLERTEDESCLFEGIRKIGRLASELGLAGQAKDIARAKRDSDRHAGHYAENKTQFCKDIVEGKRKGLSVLTAEWLRDQAQFDAPSILRGQLESDIAKGRELLTQATCSLDDIREKTAKILTLLAQDAQRALAILDETMNSTPLARFYVNADVISASSINALLDRLYGAIEARRKAHLDVTTAAQKRHKKGDLQYLRSEMFRSLFANVSVEFRHPSIWEGDKSRLRSKGLSEGMRTAISLMWVAKLAEFRLRQAIDQAGGMRRQSRAALRKERYFIILDGLFSSLSHDELIDSAMESLRASAGHFQLIGMIHHPRYINNAKIFPAYFVGRPFKATSGKHAWLTVDKHKDVPASLGVFSSHHTR